MIKIYTDGSCPKNPGAGGYAAIIEYPGIPDRVTIGGGEPNTTNNRMEILAVINALAVISKGSEVEIFSDSLYVINTMSKGWRRRFNNDLWSRMDTLCDGKKIKWTWVRGHNGHKQNEEVDRLAGIESKKQMLKEEKNAGSAV